MSVSSDPTSDDAFAVALDVQELKRKSVQGSLVTTASQGARMVIQLGSQVMLARLLFPADFGLLAMISPIIGFILVFNDMGLGQAIVQRPVLVQEQVSALFWISLGLSCVLGCAVVLVSPLLAWAYGEPNVIELMIILGILIPISALSVNPTALLSRHMRFGQMAVIDIAATSAGVVVAVICAWDNWSYWSLVAGQFVNTIVRGALAWVASGWYPSRPKFVPSAWADLRFGGNLIGANLATFVTTSGDNVIVGIATGRVALGLYDRSYRLVVEPLGQMLAPISRVALPLLSRLADQPDTYRSAYLKIVRAILLLTIPGMLVCVADGTAIIRVFLGVRWRDAAPIFTWVCVGGLTSGLYTSASWLFISQDKAREFKHFTIAASVINVLSFLIGAYVWNIIGVAALGSCGFVLVTTPLMIYGATRSGPVRASDMVRLVAPFTCWSIIVFCTLIAVTYYTTLDGFTLILISTLLSYGAFLGFALARRSERQLLHDVLDTTAALVRKRSKAPT